MGNVLARMRAARVADEGIGEVLLDQRVLAGVGNVYKSEVLFLERIDPFTPVSSLDDGSLRKIVERVRELMEANAKPGAAAGRTTTLDPRTGERLAPTSLWVYRRAGRPCHRCGTLIQSGPQGSEVPRTTYWCPSCQAAGGQTAGADVNATASAGAAAGVGRARNDL